MSSFSNNLPFPKGSIERIIKQASSWSGLNGLMYTDGKVNWNSAPISLVPNVFPKSSFGYARDLQCTINKLIDKISRDPEFIIGQLESVSQSDEFTKNLLDIYKKIPLDTIKSQVQLGILRSDYMINFDATPLQVEINTIASSFGYLSNRVGDLHRFILDRNKDSNLINDILEKVIDKNNGDSSIVDWTLDRMPPNPSISEITKALAKAHREIGQKESVILCVHQPGERNVADQRLIEFYLWKDYGIKMEFLTLHQLFFQSRIHPTTKELLIQPFESSSEEIPVSVVYYRAGYSPNDYPSTVEWESRLKLEESNAIKCPSIGYHLAGAKAIQASLCKKEILERFLTEEECSQIQVCFAEQYSFADKSLKDKYLDAMERAIEDGSKWVLKPQREGGGNNLYGHELSQFLKENKDNDKVLNGFVLMQRILPNPQITAFLKNNELSILPSISELGIYGTYIGYGPLNENSNILLNEYAGYLLRTKPSGVDEGGVASGFSVLNSIVLDESL